ncbi:MAG: hypothetical protein HYW48_10220 [Deltaproteobacteria bacterium]|nr:hypothetical protein [Deltaproteobacteria bacterium]
MIWKRKKKLQGLHLILSVFVGVAACRPAAKEQGLEAAKGSDFKIGVMFFNGNRDSRSVHAINMAIEDVNAAGIFTRKWVADFNFYDTRTDRMKLANTMINEHRVDLVVSQWSSTALHVLQFTNRSNPHLVQCSADSTNTYINDPTIQDSEDLVISDKNGTLFRIVANDRKQTNVIWEQVREKEKFAIIYINDIYGASLKDELTRKYAEAVKSNFPTEALLSYPASDFVLSQITDRLDALIAKSLEGTINTLILAGMSYDGSHILQYLTESPSPFRGHIILSDGMIETNTFSPLSEAFDVWLKTEGNSLTGVSPEMDVGENNEAWNRRLKERTKLFDTYAPGAASCVYLVALALLSAPKDEELSPDAAKIGFQNFLTKNVSSQRDSYFAVAPTVQALKEAKEMAARGKKLLLNGPSGEIVFDDDGDRLHQRYEKLSIHYNDGSFSFEKDTECDGDSGMCE